jgi:MFS transporter, MHS family, proline/betaine transporter
VKTNLRFIIGATVIGNMLEWYDFALFGFLVPLFATLFFSDVSSISAIAKPYFFFAIGAFARPIGGFIFGYIGDKWGRKRALIYSIVFMTLPVFMIAILPTYAQLGVSVIVILTTACVMQGLCTGGDFPGSVVFLVESSPPQKRGFTGCWAYFGTFLGMLIATGDLYFLDLFLKGQKFENWGWRLPFFAGALLGFTGIFLRRMLHETPVFEKAKHMGHLLKEPLIYSLQKYKKLILLGIGVFMLDAVGFNIVIIFFIAYLKRVLAFGFAMAFAVNAFSITIALICLPIFGKISSRFSSILLARFATLATAIFVVPLYLLMNGGAMWMVFTAQGCLIMLLTLYLSTIPLIISELFPTPVRYSCVAISCNVCIALFGGSAPFFAIYLIEKTEIAILPGLYIMAASLVSYGSLRLIQKGAHKNL